MNLPGKIALVTGGGSGIGLGIAQALAGEGCRTIICGRDEEKLRQAAEATSTSTSAALTCRRCDVSQREEVARLLAAVETEFGAPDILVNSAGTNVAKRLFADVDPDEFDRVIAANLTGTFNCIHAALPGMRANGGGTIVNIVSIAGHRALTLAGLPYCASKFGQGAIGTFANLEEGKHGIRVTNIYPGEVNTPIIDKRPVVPPPEKRAQMLQPEDIAACVLTVVKLPARAVVPEMILIPPYQVDVL